jgi:hypothetical protein
MQQMNVRAVVLAERNGKVAALIRSYLSRLDSEMSKVLNAQSLDMKLQRREEANEKLLRLAFHTNQLTWMIQNFVAMVTMLIQQDHADINNESFEESSIPRVCNILSVISSCRVGTVGMSDSDQYDAIMLLLSHGADPNQGNALYWVLLRFYHDKCTDSEFIELFHCLINNYGATCQFSRSRNMSIYAKGTR